MPHRYDNFDGPPRDASHSLESWHVAADQADAAQEAAERRASKALPDLYQVADAVLTPLMGSKPLRAIPRRLGTAARDALDARGEKLTRENLLLEAARFLAQERAAADPELAVALLLRAALLFRPTGGWSGHAPRGARREGFGSLGALLGAAFSEIPLGMAAIPMEIAQNRARTRSRDGEVFVQASHSGTSRARNAEAVERRTDAQALIYRSQVELSAVSILFERHVLGRYRERADLLDELRYREARRRRLPGTLKDMHTGEEVVSSLPLSMELPARPARWGLVTVGLRRDLTRIQLPRDPPDGISEAELQAAANEEAAWRLAVGVLLWGDHEKQDQHIRRCDRALLRPVEDAETALGAAIGQRRGSPRSTRVRSVQLGARPSRQDDAVPAVPTSAGEVLAGG
jgi:hypothetical protein